MNMVYCDYIVDRIKTLLNREISDNETLISDVGNVEFDLHPEEKYMVSTKKTLTLSDINGKLYRVTVEEIENV